MRQRAPPHPRLHHLPVQLRHFDAHSDDLPLLCSAPTPAPTACISSSTCLSLFAMAATNYASSRASHELMVQPLQLHRIVRSHDERPEMTAPALHATVTKESYAAYCSGHNGCSGVYSGSGNCSGSGTCTASSICCGSSIGSSLPSSNR